MVAASQLHNKTIKFHVNYHLLMTTRCQHQKPLNFKQET